MRWTLSKPCTMGGGRSVCRQDLGLVNTISLDLDRLSLRLLQLAELGPLFDMLDLGFAGILIMLAGMYVSSLVSILDNDIM